MTGKTAGTATITATSGGKSGARPTVTVTASAPVAASISVTPSPLALTVGAGAAVDGRREGRSGCRDERSHGHVELEQRRRRRRSRAAATSPRPPPDKATITATSGSKSTTVIVTVTHAGAGHAEHRLGRHRHHRAAGHGFVPAARCARGPATTTRATSRRCRASSPTTCRRCPPGATIQGATLDIAMDSAGVFGNPFALGSLYVERASSLVLNTFAVNTSSILVTATFKTSTSTDVTALVQAARSRRRHLDHLPRALRAGPQRQRRHRPARADGGAAARELHTH